MLPAQACLWASLYLAQSVAATETDEHGSPWQNPSPERIDIDSYTGWSDTDASIGYRIPLLRGDIPIYLVPLVGVSMDGSGAESRVAFEDSVGASSPFGLGLGPRAAAPHVGIAIDVGVLRIGYKLVVDVDDPSNAMHIVYLSFPF